MTDTAPRPRLDQTILRELGYTVKDDEARAAIDRTVALLDLHISREQILAMRGALRRIAREGCERLVDPSTCRKPNGYPREEWCPGCIAADGLGLSVEWFVIQR